MKYMFTLLIVLFLFSTQKTMSMLSTGEDSEISILNRPDKYGRRAIYYAVENKNLEMVQLLIDSKASPDMPGDTISPLYLAIKNQNVDIVTLLIKNRADPNSTQNPEQEPLLITAIKNVLPNKNSGEKILALLLEQPNIDFKNVDQERRTAVNYACQKNNIPALNLLLSADPNKFCDDRE